jgi:hypothetical protein
MIMERKLMWEMKEAEQIACDEQIPLPPCKFYF